jgi:hypothetical protein
MHYTNINIRLKGAPELNAEELEKVLVAFFEEQYNVPVACQFGLFTCFQCTNHKTCAGGKVVCKLSGLNPLDDPGVMPIEAAQECKNVNLITPLKLNVRPYKKKSEE